MSIQKVKRARHKQRRARVSGAVRGNTERPRLAIFRSVKHIYAQIIDDEAGRTLASANTTEAVFRAEKSSRANIPTAIKVGKAVAERAKSQNITKVVFDRGGYIYHGKVKALADAAREGGLDF